MEQCPSCGGNCGRTIKSGCLYDNAVERTSLRTISITQQEQIESLREQLASMTAERDELRRDLDEIFNQSKAPFIESTGHRLGFSALETRLELAVAERNNAFSAIALLKDQLAACQKERDELVAALEEISDHS